jgi:hypothetical protein
MLIEFALHVLPAFKPSIEVNADLMGESFVDYSGIHFFDRSAHSAAVNKHYFRNRKPPGGDGS